MYRLAACISEHDLERKLFPAGQSTKSVAAGGAWPRRFDSVLRSVLPMLPV